MTRFLSVCRTVHGWLGVLVMPWVIIIGATGLYLNHGKLFDPLFPRQVFSEAGLESLRPSPPITRETARVIGEKLWPNLPITGISRKPYQGRESYFVKKARGNIIISIPTGHYYLRTRYVRRTFAPDGRLLHTKYYWRPVLRLLHETGWLGRGLGTWLADIVAMAMVLFGTTGVLMWSVPKVRYLRLKWKTRTERP